MAVAPNAATRPRSGTPYTILGLILAALGFGAVLLFSSMGGSHAATPATTAATAEVVVAAEDIGMRTSITPSQLKIQKYVPADVPPGSFTRFQDVQNMVAAIDIKKGQPVTSNVIVKAGDAVTGAQAAFLPIPSGFVAITIPTSEQQGVAGYIQTGDYISVIGLISGGSGQNIRTLFTNVHVIRVGPATDAAPSGSSAPTAKAGGVSSSLTIVVTQCQAEYLNWFLSNASVKYSLESYKDYRPQDVQADASCPSVTAARGVTKSDIAQRWPGIFS